MSSVDYEAMYYTVQRHVTRTIQTLEEELCRLKTLQCACEEEILHTDFELIHKGKAPEDRPDA